MFRKNWNYDPSAQSQADTLAHMEDALGALQDQVAKGNIRHFGLSNESAWGCTMWATMAEKVGGPRVASVQNEYSLLCRLFDTDMAEMAVNEDIGLLAFSPLAAGLLTGKYQDGAVPDGSRKSLVPELGGRNTENVYPAVQAYLAIAARHGLDPVHMALAWCCARPFMTSVIFGATTLSQLEVALGSDAITLDDDILAELNETHKAHPMPY